MKKIILFITIFLILTGCEDRNDNSIKEINLDETIKTNTYVDNNPIKVALYEDNHIIKSYSTTLANFKEIAVFNIYYTNKEKLDSTNIKYNYQKYYNEYDNIENYKTGFYISFEAEGKKIEQLALDPTSKHAMTPYLYIYLYDDINQVPGTFYSHLEPEDMKDNTIISSIKLFLAQEGEKITSPITLTVFTYDSDDDFTKDNHYRGISSYTIKIETK